MFSIPDRPPIFELGGFAGVFLPHRSFHRPVVRESQFSPVAIIVASLGEGQALGWFVGVAKRFRHAGGIALQKTTIVIEQNVLTRRRRSFRLTLRGQSEQDEDAQNFHGHWSSRHPPNLNSEMT